MSAHLTPKHLFSPRKQYIPIHNGHFLIGVFENWVFFYKKIIYGLNYVEKNYIKIYIRS